MKKAVKNDLESRGRILRSAKNEFSRKGFNGARMSDIARMAGVNKALIHYYFKDKDSLYYEVLRKNFIGDGTYEAPIFVGKWDLTPSQKLYVIIYFLINVLLKATDPEVYRIVFWELAEGNRHFQSMVNEHHMHRQRIFINIINEGIEKGEFETDYPTLSVMNVTSFISLYSVNKIILGDSPIFKDFYGDYNDEDIFNFILEHVFKSLRPASRPLNIPAIPDDLKGLLNQLIAQLIEKKDEGINDSIFDRVQEILIG